MTSRGLLPICVAPLVATWTPSFCTRWNRALRGAAIAIVLFAGVAPGAFADGTGWVTPAPTTKGRVAYAQKCAVCHGAQLQGTGAPALKGTQFVAQWNGKKLSEFYEYTKTNMPLGASRALAGQ